MKFQETALPGAFVIEPELRQDSRGCFFRVFCRREFQTTGLPGDFVQFNHSVNYRQGTVRGMHYQLPPASEGKLVRCISGRIFDVMVDIRKDSATFLQWFGVELSGANRTMVYLPEGFAHGFQTLEDNSEVLYHSTAYYQPEYEKGLRYDDPMLRIKWPGPINLVSDKDKRCPLLDSNFRGVAL